MAAINDLISRIQDAELRKRIDKELKELNKQKKFGLVFENHMPEMILLYDYPISRGCKVILKSDDDKKLAEGILWEVKNISHGKATIKHFSTGKELQVNCKDIICVAKNGEPIYPCLKHIDSVQNAPKSSLWHTLIEADNYHALQLLAYLYPHKVDCIFIDPPYNSGATDWKYNNNYVDERDNYRHSKWLAMMESRLLLAQKLLNPQNSVLIITIDEKEYMHLSCLLEDIFPEAEGDANNNYKGRVSIQMITNVINPKGNRRNNEFSRCEEYIFIVYFGAASICSNGSDMLRTESTEESEGDKSIRMKALLRSAGNHGRRIDRPNLFYPLLFSKESGSFRGPGPVLSIDEDRRNYCPPEDCVAMWPIGTNGIELTWNLQPDTLKQKSNNHFLRFGKWDGKQRVAYYLTSGQEENFNNGRYNIVGTDSDGGYILELKDETKKDVRPLSVWYKTTHSASDYGTTFLNKIIGSGRFPFPKSIYAVHDIIRFFVANKPDALILDFFAGSGTTLHAVNLLNKEDDGNRRCIMVTNNEVSSEEEAKFRAKGLHKGDNEWEIFGIARYVNWPRTKCSIKGIDIDGNPLEGDYFTYKTDLIYVKRSIKQLSFIIPEGSAGKKVKKQIVSLINDKKMPQNSVTDDCAFIVGDDAVNAVLFDPNYIDDFIDEIHNKIETIYIVTPNNDIFRASKLSIDRIPEKKKNVPVKIPMSAGFETNASYFKLSFLNKEAVSIGAQLNELLPLLWMKAGAYGVCPTHIEGEYAVFEENKMAILLEEFGFDELSDELLKNPQIETVYIIEDSEENYRTLASKLKVKQTFQLYRDYLDNFKINIERR